MKRGAYFLNLARAAIVDDEALYAALRDGHLAGAALDVFADEPVRPENRYVQLPNVLVAPHLGGATRDVVAHQTDMIVDGIEAWLRGERPTLHRQPGRPRAAEGLRDRDRRARRRHRRREVRGLRPRPAGCSRAQQRALELHGRRATATCRWSRSTPSTRRRSGQILAAARARALAARGARAARRDRRRRRPASARAASFSTPTGARSTPVPTSTAAASWKASRCSARSASSVCTRSPATRRRSSSRWRATSGTASTAAAPVARILMINDWMTYRLCGVASTEPSNATESMLFDLRRRDWSDEILRALRHPGRDAAAGIRRRASASARVHAGGRRGHRPGAGHAGVHRRRRHAVRAARRRRGRTGRRGGDPRHDDARSRPSSPSRRSTRAANLWAGCHVVPERWVIESNAGSTGDAYLWLLDLLVPAPGDRYARAEELARARARQRDVHVHRPARLRPHQAAPRHAGRHALPLPDAAAAADRRRRCCAPSSRASPSPMRANLAQIEAVTGRRRRG